LSGIRSSAKNVLKSYALRERSRNPKTNALRMTKQSARRRFGDKLTRPLVKVFVGSAVQQFAAGNLREARYFYDGAFEFGDRDLVRGTLLTQGLATAKRAFHSGDYLVVWRLLAATHTYAPDCLSCSEINELFGRFGVPISALGAVPDDPAVRRLQSVGANLPVQVAA
jgi:hypothetical protein